MKLKVWIVQIKAKNTNRWSVISVHLWLKEARALYKDAGERFPNHRRRLVVGLLTYGVHS